MAKLEDRISLAIKNAGLSTSDFDLNPPMERPAERLLKPAAVLIPITSDGQLILTKRAAHLNHHPGQIAFPGGRQDSIDADLNQTALREAHEEIALKPDTVRILGQLPCHETVTQYSVTPIVGLLPTTNHFQPEPGEVAEVFSVPLSFVMQKRNFRVEGRFWRGTMRKYYVVPFGPYYIWGATARILRSLAEGWA